MYQGKIDLLIVDDNKEFCSVLRDFFSVQNDINVVGTAYDGLEGLRLIKETAPDIVILDMIMPQLDGLGVLEKLNSSHYSPMPKIIMFSAVGQDRITQRALELGADYYVVKPFEMSILLKRIREMFTEADTSSPQKIHEPDSEEAKSIMLEKQITNIIHEFGVPANIQGYKYLREAITLAANDVTMLSAIMRKLYPTIAEKFNTTPTRVERSIRHAIEVAWTRSNSDTLSKILGYSPNENNKPTNSQLIASLVDMLRINNKMS